MKDFAKALKKLPATAPAEEVLDWIAAHPAMMRAAWREEDDEKVRITIEDVLRPPHGIAPCRVAVNQLAYFCNAPDRFFSKLLDRQVKSKSVEKATEVVDDLKDLDAMLEQFRGEKPKG